MAAKKKAASKKVAAKTEEPGLPVAFEGDVGGGMEGTDRESFAIPFLRVLQKGSPQVDEAEAAYVEGAEQGMLYNTVTGALYKGEEGCVFLPCAYQRRFIRWAPRGSEGSFKGEYLPEEVAKMREDGVVQELDRQLMFPTDGGELHEKKCDRLVDTRSHFGLVMDANGLHQCVLPLASTQIKKSKQLMSALSALKVRTANGMATPPTWASQVRITTVRESNDDGTWWGVKFTLEGYVQDADAYATGRAFYETIMAGDARANYADAAEDKGEDKPF